MDANKQKALDLALGQIEKRSGKKRFANWAEAA